MGILVRSKGLFPLLAATTAAGLSLLLIAPGPGASAGVRPHVRCAPGGRGVSPDCTPSPPSVYSLSPSSGPASGGTTVTITGLLFNPSGLWVDFGSVPAASVTWVSSTEVIAVSPAVPASTVDVTVYDVYGRSAIHATDQYTYVGPLVAGVSPPGGPAGGGTSVTITGSGFTGATAVMFGSAPASGVTVVSDSQITATAPAQSPGTTDVTVTTPDGTSPASTADQFTYVPVVSGVSPAAGPAAGGTSVTITGSGFTGATAVDFGSVAAPGYTVNSDGQITATTPAQATGTVDVTVVTPGGTTATSPADQFSYVPAPAVSDVSPAAGPTAGGTSVTITGSGFTGATAVMFGAVAAPGYTVNSDGQITAVSPASVKGSVDVTVTTAGGTSQATAADAFTFAAKPRILAVSPSSGSTAGGTVVTITGAGFAGAMAVSFGKVAASSFTVLSGAKITAVSPAHAAGTVHITLTTPGGVTKDTTANVFTYSAAVGRRAAPGGFA